MDYDDDVASARRLTLGLWAACASGGCLDAEPLPAEPLGPRPAAFLVALSSDDAVLSLRGPFAIDATGTLPPVTLSLGPEERLLLLALSEEALRALPGGYGASTALGLRLLPEPEDCGPEGRFLEASSALRVPVPEESEVLELDRATLRFRSTAAPTPLRGWSLELPLARWCDHGPDLSLTPFLPHGSFPPGRELRSVLRIDDDRAVVTSTHGAILAERNRPVSLEPSRAVLTAERRGPGTSMRGLVRDPARTRAGHTVLVAWIDWANRREGALLELIVDESGLREGKWTDLPHGPVSAALIDEEGRFFGVGGVNLDIEAREGSTVGMVVTASTTSGSFAVRLEPNFGPRVLARGPDPAAPHWVGTSEGRVLEGHLSRRLDEFRASTPEAGSIYTLVALGTVGSGPRGLATTSVPATVERRDGDWRPAPGLPLPPSVKDCEAVGVPDACGFRRWSSPRASDGRWSPERPWEARFTPSCDVLFLWDAEEGCMSLAAEDLERGGERRRMLGSYLDAGGRRLTVVGSGARIYEAWRED